MRVLFDLNVVLDVLLDRGPHQAASTRALDLAAEGKCSGLVCASSVDTLFYVLGRSGVRSARARRLVNDLLSVLEVAPVDGAVIRAALASNWDDFEDAVVHESARHASALAIVTRNPRDFSNATLTILEPADLLAVVDASNRST